MIGYPYQEEQGGTGGCAPEEQGPQGLRLDPPRSGGSDLGVYPWNREGTLGPWHGVGVLIKIPCSILIGYWTP